jgi:hypothetical protein
LVWLWRSSAYALNPYLVRVETVPMLVVKQGEVAVIKAAVGLPPEGVSGDEFKFGSIVGVMGFLREFQRQRTAPPHA